MAQDPFHRLPRGGFLYARLVPVSPVPGAWLVSGYMSTFPKSGAAQIAQVALRLAATQPELVFRNPEKIEQGWKQMRADRAAFIEYFYNDYGMLRELFADPALAVDKRYSDVLRGYHRPAADPPPGPLPP